jgi:hypothetical protein
MILFSMPKFEAGAAGSPRVGGSGVISPDPPTDRIFIYNIYYHLAGYCRFFVTRAPEIPFSQPPESYRWHCGTVPPNISVMFAIPCSGLKRMNQGAIMAISMYHPGIRLEGLENTTRYLIQDSS